ncbi:caspase family protein [Roseibium sp. FZY0029]|uniref:caspase family protein n=1 Tax=Roseibium sp. FZY0029 TaxID=3116647 RepID=UPI002EBF8AA9|nr:caspase family protein [Roseibium sp. FZY0029]
MKLCLTIGVSRAQPLSYLPGAITAAKEMKEWAERSGYRTTILTDDGKDPVTVSRIRTALLELLPENDIVNAFVLHFAGHGYRAGAEQNMWLPSDWNTELRAISVEGLKKRLYGHGIENLTILSDACRSLPSSVDIADLSQDSVLPRGPYDPSFPIIDRFNAVTDGKEAYMLPGDENAPARCIFSSVLLEGLSGHRDEAFDKYVSDCVTSESLDLFSKARMKEISELYRLKCAPENTVGTPRDHFIYFRRDNPGNGDAATLLWPAPPETPSAPSAGLEISKHAPPQEDEALFELAPAPHDERPPHDIRQSFRLGREYAHEDVNLVILGPTPTRLWTTEHAADSGNKARPSEYKVDVSPQSATQILVEFDDGIFASTVVYDELLTVLSRDERGVIGWACASRWAEAQPQINSSIDAISNLQAGRLSADQVDNIAAQLREMKHVNPTLGAISSYLYDYSGDIDSIRRMAYFYCLYGQAIPFDIAYMGLLPFHRNGPAYATDVPSIAARSASPENDRLPEWVTRGTEPISGFVAGLWPWLRQGWEFVEEPENEEVIPAEHIRDVIPYLLPSQFTSFSRDGAEILIRKFHMEGN